MSSCIAYQNDCKGISNFKDSHKCYPLSAKRWHAWEEQTPLYLTRFSYTPATWAKLIKNPEDRRVAAKQSIEAVGGKMHGFWYAFGAHDAYNLWEAPDNTSMAATAIAIGAGGAISSFQTTVLLTGTR